MSQDAYTAQVLKQLDKTRQELRAAEDELAAWRKRNHQEDRLRAAWHSARRRAAAQHDRGGRLLADHVQAAARSDFRAPHEPADAPHACRQCEPTP